MTTQDYKNIWNNIKFVHKENSWLLRWWFSSLFFMTVEIVILVSPTTNMRTFHTICLTIQTALFILSSVMFIKILKTRKENENDKMGYIIS